MRLKNVGLVCGVVLGIWSQSAAMNGFAVSASQAAENNLGNWPEAGKLKPTSAGHIAKYTIEDNKVIRCDTIYKQYWASFPILNVQGNHVAFLRENVNSGSDNWRVNAGNQFITVMDINGNNARDLDTLRSYDANCRVNIRIAWPAGDYIYYHYNIYISYGPESWTSNGNPRAQIWRVKYNDASTQQLVYTYRDAHTFSLSLDGTKAALTSGQGCAGKSAPFCNIPHTFPPTSDPDAGSWAGGLVLGCGSSISPSGKHHWHFWEGGHTDNRIETITFPSQVVSTVSTNFNTIADWIITATPGLTRDSITGGSMEWSRWASNSDKWICGQGRNKIGATNQILWNWIDHTAINTSRNSKTLGTFAPSSECGALWVAGGPCGSYEDVNGNWIATSVSSGCDGTDVALPPSRINHTSSVVSHDVKVYTVHGRLIGVWNRAKLSQTGPAGTYLIAPLSVKATAGSTQLVSNTNRQ